MSGPPVRRSASGWAFTPARPSRIGGGYTGLAVHRTARICAAAHGGQVLVSQATQTIIEDEEEATRASRWWSVGERKLKDLDRPVRLFRLAAPGLGPPDPSAAWPPGRGTAGDVPAAAPALPGDIAGLRRPPRRTRCAAGGRPSGAGHAIGGAGAGGCRRRRPRCCGDGVRLVTLTGPGGIGKARLGLRWRGGSAAFADGVRFVAWPPSRRRPGAPRCRRARTASGADGRRRGVPPAEQADAAAAGQLRAGAAAAPLVAELLAAAPAEGAGDQPGGAASARRARVPGATAAGPAGRSPAAVGRRCAQYAAVACSSSGRMPATRFAVTDENAPAVAEICHRLDGLPLAIELAAARIRLLSPRRCWPGWSDRLALLTGGRAGPAGAPADAAGHHRLELRSAPPAEQALFARLAVFAGGFSLAAAEAVCGERALPGRARRRAGDRHPERTGGQQPGPVAAQRRPAAVQAAGNHPEYALERLRARGERARRTTGTRPIFRALAEPSGPSWRAKGSWRG